MAARSAPPAAYRRGGVTAPRFRAPATRAAPAAYASPVAPAASSPATPPSSPLPATYRRLVAPRTGRSLREVATVVTVPTPAPGPGEVLLRVRYAGVNGGCETFRARGEHWFAGNAKKPGGFPLGAEGAGEVVALGEGVQLALGDAVTFVGGAFSEFVLAPAASCWRVPAATPEAVACTISGVTAAASLRATARVQAGDVVLVTAAAGGTGHFAVQVAVAAGAHVVATCGGARKAELVRSLGAHRVIDHTAEDVAAVLAAEYPRGVDVVYEGVGSQMLVTAMNALAEGGRVLVIGYISGYPHAAAAAAGDAGESPAMRANALAERLFWSGGTLEIGGGRRVIGGVWPDRASILAAKRELFNAVQAGTMRAVIDDTASFDGVDSVADAVDHMLSRATVGKVVVRIG